MKSKLRFLNPLVAALVLTLAMTALAYASGGDEPAAEADAVEVVDGSQCMPAEADVAEDVTATEGAEAVPMSCDGHRGCYFFCRLAKRGQALAECLSRCDADFPGCS